MNKDTRTKFIVVSKFLFKTSLDHKLAGNYLNIFVYMLNNVTIMNLFSLT
jgi:hypothetical protein